MYCIIACNICIIRNKPTYLLTQYTPGHHMHERLDPPPSGQYYIYSRECASAKFSETQLYSAVWAIYNGLPCPYKVKLDRPIV